MDLLIHNLFDAVTIVLVFFVIVGLQLVRHDLAQRIKWFEHIERKLEALQQELKD
jgi:hypothetical protein